MSRSAPSSWPARSALSPSLWLTGVEYQEYSYYQTFFKGPVTGLGKGTVTRYNGIDVGRVTTAIRSQRSQSVIVTLQVQPNLNIREDIASIESQGLTGGVYVEISGGSRNAAVLRAKPGENYPMIASKPSTIQQLTAAAPELLARISLAVDSINRTLSDKNQVALSNTLQHLDAATGALAKETPEIAITLRNLSATTAKLPGVIADADASVKKIGKLSEDADAYVAGDNPAQLSRLIAETRELVTNLNRLTEQLNHQPTSVFFGDRREGYTPHEQ